MREYPKAIKRLICEYATQAYEAELNQALRELEQHFQHWQHGAISPFDLSDHIHTFHSQTARELWSRYNARMDDAMVARAIVIGLLPAASIPAELREALAPLLEFYKQEHEAAT
ncbi:hypothetical protein [Candidatus Oscillochloris fontis]|uniref:hypothetical protein n=1 Tax=Candidatus Oscillochloris fontis TaxID=2496868 RepID=UPI00101CC5C0|nr:hypothetical protein [Candidatus Oscillochloris fontis]